jgi:hypothetical protein
LEAQFDCADGSGEPLNLDGAHVVWKLDDYAGTRILTLDETTGLSIDVPLVSGGPPTGVVYLHALPEQTDLPPGFYRDELSVINKNGIHSTQVSGRIEFVARLA